MTTEPTAAERMFKLYGVGNGRTHYVADFKDAKIDPDGKVRPEFRNVKRRVTTKDFEKHLNGELALLSVPAGPDGLCRWGVIDVDVYNVDPLALVKQIKARGLSLIMERSKSGGWHLAHYCREAVSAAFLHATLTAWAADLGFPTAEVFPKQGDTEVGEGSGILIPYFGGDDTSNYAIDWEGQKVSLDVWLSGAESMPSLKECLALAEKVDGPPEDAIKLLAKHWEDSKRQSLSFCISGFLLRRGGKSIDYCKPLMDAVVARTGIRPKNFREPADVQRQLDKGGHVSGFPSMIKIMGEADATAFAKACGIDMSPADAKDNADTLKPFPLDVIYSATNFATLALPPREWIVDDLIRTQSLVMLFAARGVGKTMLAFYLAVEVARGGRFLEWSIKQPRQVLYVDGEMPGAELQERLRGFAGVNVPDKLDLISSETFYQTEGAPLNLANDVHQIRLLGLLDMLKERGRHPELIVLDNKSALSAGTEENSNSEQDSILALLRTLRHRGHAVLLIHHAGKGGDQRGASRNEDFLDLSIKLEIPTAKDDETLAGAEGAAFRMTFTKHRGLRPKPHVLDLELMADFDGTYTWAMKKPARVDNWMRVLEYLCERVATKQVEIAHALKLDAADVSKAVKYLRARTMLEPDNLAPTHSGRAYADKVRGGRGGGVGNE